MTLPFASNRYHVAIWMIGGLLALGMFLHLVIDTVKALR